MAQLPNYPITAASRQWYVIQTKPGNERRVEIHLINQEIETFLPLLETYQQCSKEIIRRIRPFFPNYLFARLDLDLHYYKVKWTRGVNRILGNGSEPIPISGRVIQMIGERMRAGNLVVLDDEWKEGDPVQVVSGPFKELRGVFQKRMSDQGRVRILLNFIGVDMPVQLPQWQVKKVA